MQEEYDKDSVIQELQRQLEMSQAQSIRQNTALAGSSFVQNRDENLMQYQLETMDMLDKLEHFLRGDQIKIDEKGNENWVTPEDDSLILFNEYGINSMLSIIGMYFNRNTVLSQYDDMRINEILTDLGQSLRIFVYCNYEKMGMNTEFKKTRYPLVIINIIHTIESTYRRAIHFKTAETLNSARIFTQSDIIGRGNNPIQMPKRRGFNLFRPRSW